MSPRRIHLANVQHGPSYTNPYTLYECHKTKLLFTQATNEFTIAHFPDTNYEDMYMVGAHGLFNIYIQNIYTHSSYPKEIYA